MQTRYAIAIAAVAIAAIVAVIIYSQIAAPAAMQPAAPPEVPPAGVPNVTQPAVAPPAGVPNATPEVASPQIPITNVTTPSGPAVPPPPPPPPIVPVIPPAANETNATGNVTAPLVLPGGTPAVSNVSATEFEINAWNFAFSPASITVNKGATVRLKIFNQGGTHSMNIGAPYNIAMDLPALQTTVVEFTASESGTFEFWCASPSHRDMGMNGTLTVTG